MKTIIEEPFGLYTLKMAKADSDRALKPHREHTKRVQRWQEYGMTIVTVGFAFMGVSAFALAGVTSV